MLYVDDGAFPFEYWKQLTLVAQLISDHFKRFGMEMHIRRGGGFSKIECMFFPPPGLFKNKEILPASENGILDGLLYRPNTVRAKEEERLVGQRQSIIG